MQYTTQMHAAKLGILTEQMRQVAQNEKIDPAWLREKIAAGEIAIPANVHHTNLAPQGVGAGLRTKINVNLGISGDSRDYEREMGKARLAIEIGTDAIMDLSNCGKTREFRR